MAELVHVSLGTKTLRLLEKTSARDRLYRILQYASKFISWLLEQEGVGSDVIARFRTLEASISLARKLFRLGKSLDHLRMSFQTINLKDPALRFFITFSKINRFLYLLLDHIVWAGRVRLVTIDNKQWTLRSARFWFLAVLFNLVRDLYDFFIALRTEQYRLSHDSTGAERTLRNAIKRAATNNPALILDLVKNSTDVFLPLSQLRVGSGLSSGFIGVMGVVSSFCGLVAIWNEALKLKYS